MFLFRYILLKLALKWIKEVRASTEDVPTLQLQVYSTCLQDSFSFEVTYSYSPEIHCLETHIREPYWPETHFPATHSPDTHRPKTHCLETTHNPLTHSPETHCPATHCPAIRSSETIVLGLCNPEAHFPQTHKVIC